MLIHIDEAVYGSEPYKKLDIRIEEIEKLMEEMAGEPRMMGERQPGEMNSYEKHNREIDGKS